MPVSAAPHEKSKPLCDNMVSLSGIGDRGSGKLILLAYRENELANKRR